MGCVEEYRTCVEKVLTEFGDYKPSHGNIEVQLAFDRERDHYLLFNTGWHNNRRTHGCVLHIDIKGGKIWIQHDGTEIGMANALVELGVPKEDIVLAFHTPYKRKYTGFAEG